MAVTYRNFRGDIYYLHRSKTKKGYWKYFFSKKENGTAELDEIPQGYEIYENPNGQVFLRKITKQIIRPEELKIIEQGMKNYSKITDFKLDVKKNLVYIYTVVDFNTDDVILEMIGNSLNNKQYHSEMRFRLDYEEPRTFSVERYNYLGSIDDWIFLNQSDNLEQLVKDYVKHLGEESFFNLI